MVALSSYLLVAAALFALGVAGVLLRRNMLAALIALILMFNASALVFAAFGHGFGDTRYWLDPDEIVLSPSAPPPSPSPPPSS